MGWTTLAAIYVVIWWTVLFAVLPFGVRSQEEAGEIAPGSDPGAPAGPRLLTKFVWTTIVATIVFAAFVGVYAANLIDIERFVTVWGLFPR